MSVSPIITHGFGSYGTVNLVVTYGFTIQAAVNIISDSNLIGYIRKSCSLTAYDEPSKSMTGYI